MRLTSRYDDNDVNITVHKIKKQLSSIMVYIIKLRESSRISYLLQQIKSEQYQTEQQKTKVTKKNKVLPSPKTGDIYVDPIMYATEPIKWMEYLMKNNKIDITSSMDTTMILLDLTLYKNDSLVNMAFEFIYDFYTQRRKMLHGLKEVQLLEDGGQIEIYKKL